MSSFLHPRLMAMLALLASAAVVQAQQAQPRTQPGQAQPGRAVQQPAQPGQAVRPVAPGGGQQARGQMDAVLAACLIIGNHGEVQAAQFAREKAHSEDVKTFATMMIQDHGAFVNQLRELSPQAAAMVNLQAGQRDDQRQPEAQPERRAAGQPAQPGAAAAGGSFAQQMIQLKQEVGQQCLASLKKKLGEKEGADFDKAYIGTQWVMHMQMIDEMKVFKEHASPQLAEAINEGIQTAQDHMMHTERLMQKLYEGGPRTARRPADQPERPQPERRNDK